MLDTNEGSKHHYNSILQSGCITRLASLLSDLELTTFPPLSLLPVVSVSPKTLSRPVANATDLPSPTVQVVDNNSSIMESSSSSTDTTPKLFSINQILKLQALKPQGS